MKKLIMGLCLISLFAVGCASEEESGKGGTGDEYTTESNNNPSVVHYHYHSDAIDPMVSPIVPYGNGGW